MGFPVLRLPYLALKEVILSTEKTDVINLAMSSRKTCRLVNSTGNAVSIQKLSEEVVRGLNARDKLNIALLEELENNNKSRKIMSLRVSKHLLLNFEFEYWFKIKNQYAEHTLKFQIQINSTSDRIQGKEGIIKFGDIYVPVVTDSKGTICTFWEDIDHGSQVISEHFLQKFKLVQGYLDANPEGTSGSKFSKDLKNAVDILETHLDGKPVLLSLENIESLTDSDYQLLFRGFEYSDIYITRTPNIRFPDNFQCEGKKLEVKVADGFSLKNLLNSKCETIDLRRTQMTSRVMKKVLLHWLDGKLETLRNLDIQLREKVNVEMVISGLSERDGFVLDRTEDSISITRGDGRRAVIPNDNETKYFEMVIKN